MDLQKRKICNGSFLIGSIDELQDFETIWSLHPSHFNKIDMFEKEVFLPRWQQAYGRDYFFSRQTSKALPVSKELEPYLQWAKRFNPAYNGLLLNWYDSDLKHYIGKHTDSTSGLVKGSHIITLSLEADRAFRIREKGKKGFEDIVASNGTVIVIPWKTNLTHTHEVPYLVKYPGKRISITIRAFS